MRFASLGQQSFWLDEAATGRLVRMGLGGLLRTLPDGESTPPLYYVLAWLWTRLAGTGEVGLRSLSALLGTLTIPVLYAAGSRLLDRRAGLAAAALAAFSPLLVWYSQEARSYALLVALSAVSLWALAGAVEPKSGRRPLVLWGLACALAMATHYFAVFVVAPEMVWLLRARGRAAGPALIGVVAAGAALAPLALHQRAQGTAAFIAASPRATRLGQAAKQLAVGYDAPGQVALAAAAAVLVLALVWLGARRVTGGARRRALGLAGVAAAAVGAPIALALLGLDYVITRNLIGAWVPAALALSAGGALSGRRAGPGMVAGLCALGLVATLGVVLDARYQRDDWRGAARTLPGPGPAALVVTPASGSVALAYYLPASRRLPAAGAPVEWVEVIGLGARGVGRPLSAPRLASATPMLAGFGVPQARRGATFTVLRYRALGAPVLVTPALLAPVALAPGSPATLVAGR
ncbi:MAG: mannosyltransferase [Solirubrobacteraceae bacterium]|nr:mannosyltransferase [Solirubrobacteraceae bacterium]